MSNFASRITRAAGEVFDLRVAGMYYIVQIPRAKQPAFRRAVETDEGFVLEEFGTILHRGWGEPDDALKAQLHEKYGMV